MGAGKTYGAWLSGDIEDRFLDHVGRLRVDNYSDFIRTLIEREIGAQNTLPNVFESGALVRLAKAFHPTYAEAIERWCRESKIDQGRALAKWLEDLATIVENSPAIGPLRWRARLENNYMAAEETRTVKLDAPAAQADQKES